MSKSEQAQKVRSPQALAAVASFSVGAGLTASGAYLSLDSIVGQVLLTTGTTFIAVPLVTSLLHFFTGDPVRDLIRELGEVSRISGQANAVGLQEIYSQRARIPTEQFEQMARTATSQILIATYAMEFLVDSPVFLKELAGHSRRGGSLRVVLANPSGNAVRERDAEEANEGSIASRVETAIIRARAELGECFSSSVRLQDAPLYASLYIFDHAAYICLTLFGQRGSKAPTLLLRAGSPLFDSYMQHFNDIWDRAVAPEA